MQPLTSDVLQSVRLVASDMDGTLTQQGKFTPALLRSLDALAKAEIQVLIITGRSAGWMSGIASYLPVMGAIAENGGVFFRSDAKNGAVPEFLVPIANLSAHRQRLAALFHQLKAEFPQIQESADNQFRLTDWTYEVAGLSLAEIHRMRDRCLAEGWGFTYSTVQCHLKLMQQDKAIGLSQILQQYFSAYKPDQIVTVGDSPNDESLFQSDRFPLSVGVANIKHYVDQMQCLPRYVVKRSEAEGFCEFTEQLLQSRTNLKNS
ncbi:HAD family phosphatase [Phormidium tenue FACHB-886]|nr:HAD family phosphatase [Phormidium tenue FACHB-886]